MTTPAPLVWGCTDRLQLREFGPDDRDDIVAMHREPRLRALLIDDYPLHHPAVARIFIDKMLPLYRQHEGLGIWHAAMKRREPDASSAAAVFAGWFSLMPMPGRDGEVEIGSRLLPRAWGGGLALEGCEIMLNHALDDLGLARVWGICHADNRSARAVLAAAGFESLGTMLYQDHPADHYQIDLNVWRELRNTPRATRLRRTLKANAVHRARSGS